MSVSPTHSFDSFASFEEKFILPCSPPKLTEVLDHKTEPFVTFDRKSSSGFIKNNVQAQNFTKVKLGKLKQQPVVLLTKLNAVEIINFGCEISKPITSDSVSSSGGFQFGRTKKRGKYMKRKLLYKKPPIPRISCPHSNCSRTFLVTEECRRQAHLKRVHEGIKKCHICEVCNESFAIYKQFKVHQSIHTGVSPCICEHCQEVCKSYDHLKLHIATKHKPELIKFRCEYCDEAFVKRDDYDIHLLLHTNRKRFLCEICSMSFKTTTYLKYHQSKHHSDQAQCDPIKCKECGKTFAAPGNLRCHIKKQHRGEYKLKCQLCEYGALNNCELKKHITNKHCDERNFKCDLCPKTFKHISRLTVHKRTHTGEKPYECKTCLSRFHVISRLKRHELIHSKEQCHVCEICGKQFPVKDYLYLHMRSHNKKIKQVGKKLKPKSTNHQGQMEQLTPGPSKLCLSNLLTDAGAAMKNSDDGFSYEDDRLVLPEAAWLTESNNVIFQNL